MKHEQQMQLTPTSAPPGVCLKAEGSCLQPVKPELLQPGGPANSTDLQFTEDDLAYMDDAGNAEGTPGGVDLMGLGAPRRGSDDDFIGYIRGWEAADAQAAAATAAGSTDGQPAAGAAGHQQQLRQAKPGAFKGAAALVPDSCSPMICTGMTGSARTTCTAPSGSTATAVACNWQHAPSASRCSCADENSPSMGATADPAGSAAAAAAAAAVAARPAATGAAAAAAVAGSMALADFSLDEGALLAEMFGLVGDDSPLGSGAGGTAPAIGGSGTAAAGAAAGSGGGGPTSSADADSNATMMHPPHHMMYGGHASYSHHQQHQHQRYEGGQLPLAASPRMVINRLTAGSTGGHQQLMLGSQPGMMHSGSGSTATHHHVVVSTHHPHHPMSQQGPAGRMPFVPPGWMPSGVGPAGAPGGQRAPGSMMMPQQLQGGSHPHQLQQQQPPPPQHCLPGGPQHMQQWQHAFCSCCPPGSQQHGMHHTMGAGSMPPVGGMPGMMPVVRPQPPYMAPPPSCGAPQPGMVVTTGGSAGLPVWANGNRTLSSIRTSMPPAGMTHAAAVAAQQAPPAAAAAALPVAAPAAAAPNMTDIHPAALGGFPQQALTEPPKRKRGRPRKHPLPIDAAAAAAAAPVTFGISTAAVSQPPKAAGLPPLGAGLPATRVPAYLQQQQAQGLASFGSWSLEPSAVKRGSLGGSSSSAASAQLQRKRSSSFTGFEDLAEPRKNSKSNLHGMQRAPSGQLAASGSSVLLPSLASERSVDISFADLVRDSFFPPGCYAFSVGHVERAVARVTPAGDIWWGGKQYASISGFALDVVRTIYPGRQACNGWKESWLGQLQLEQWRAAFRIGQPPPVVPEACHVTGPEAAAPTAAQRKQP